MKIKFLNKGNTLIVNLYGELDHHSCEYLKRKLDCEILKVSTKNLIFDMENLSFMDSSGIAVVLRSKKRMTEAGGRLWVQNPAPQAERVLSASGISRLVAIETSKGGDDK